MSTIKDKYSRFFLYTLYTEGSGQDVGVRSERGRGGRPQDSGGAMFYGGKVETMMPKLHSQNFEGMELIRPMYLIKEDDIIAWRDYNQLNFIQCACRFTENCVSCGGGRGSKRDEMKELIKEFRKQGDIIEKNIFRSVHNVNLRTIIGYHKDDMEYNFLDDYNERGK